MIMRVYKQMVRSKRELLMELGFITWRTRQEITELLTIIAKRVSEIRFENIIHSIITSDMSPQEVVSYLTFVEIPMKEVN
jgi:hypothetical protein